MAKNEEEREEFKETLKAVTEVINEAGDGCCKGILSLTITIFFISMVVSVVLELVLKFCVSSCCCCWCCCRCGGNNVSIAVMICGTIFSAVLLITRCVIACVKTAHANRLAMTLLAKNKTEARRFDKIIITNTNGKKKTIEFQ